MDLRVPARFERNSHFAEPREQAGGAHPPEFGTEVSSEDDVTPIFRDWRIGWHHCQLHSSDVGIDDSKETATPRLLGHHLAASFFGGLRFVFRFLPLFSSDGEFVSPRHGSVLGAGQRVLSLLNVLALYGE